MSKTSGAQPGNINGAKNKPWSEAITKFGIQNPNKRDKVIEKLFDMALDGNMLAIKEIVDRTDGKAIQGMELDTTVTERRIISSEPMKLEDWEKGQNKAVNE